MNRHDDILAKSIKKDGISVSLFIHLCAVADLAVRAAEYANLDVTTAKLGGLLHDIGKVSPLFQRVLHGYRPSPLEMRFRHEIASLFFLKVIEERYWNPVIDMIIAHHKSVVKDVRELGLLDLDYYYDHQVFTHHSKGFDEWSSTALDILEECGIKSRPITIEDAYDTYSYALEYCKKRTHGWSIWKGVLIGADHFASALPGEYSHINTLFAIPDISFYNRQHELYPLSLIKSDKTKKHTFVKAPTGSGKTDFLLKRCMGRVFYTLPFQASINAMYERVCRDLNGKVDDIRILHSISRLIIDDKNRLEEKVIQDKFGSSIKILTPHQLASIVFGTKGYESILFDLQGCDIILDEIHTYSDMMQSIVLKMVEILNNVNCHIHIGTATMPTPLEHAILNILDKDEIQYVSLENEILETFNRHIVYKGNSFDDFLPQLNNALQADQKVLLVCNRVKNAQSLYGRMVELYPDVDKMLIHSRFKRKDRNRLEKDLKEVFNRSTEACIVVSTQVVEVSLDISFDLMITETAPVDALIQRFGRINRARVEKAKRNYKSVCVIASPEKEGDCKPYSKEVLKRSYEALPDNQILDERNLQQLIDLVYPQIEIIDIDLDTVFADTIWRIKELQHNPKSALLEKLDIDSVACVTQADVEDYKEVTSDEKRMLEIPASYNSVRWKSLDRINDKGTNPYIVPDKAYNENEGLDINLLSPGNYNVEYQML